MKKLIHKKLIKKLSKNIKKAANKFNKASIKLQNKKIAHTLKQKQAKKHLYNQKYYYKKKYFQKQLEKFDILKKFARTRQQKENLKILKLTFKEKFTRFAKAKISMKHITPLSRESLDSWIENNHYDKIMELVKFGGYDFDSAKQEVIEMLKMSGDIQSLAQGERYGYISTEGEILYL